MKLRTIGRIGLLSLPGCMSNSFRHDSFVPSEKVNSLEGMCKSSFLQLTPNVRISCRGKEIVCVSNSGDGNLYSLNEDKQFICLGYHSNGFTILTNKGMHYFTR